MKKLVLLLMLCFSFQSIYAEKYALIIAVGDYPKKTGWSTISSVNDVPLIEQSLLNQGFPEDNIQVLINEEGKVMNANMHDYKMPTIGDCPDEVLSMPVETQPHPDGPFGAKGIGEPGCVPTAPAVANAVYDALGVRIKDLPVTPEKVLAAIREKQGLDLCGQPVDTDDAAECTIEE